MPIPSHPLRVAVVALAALVASLGLAAPAASAAAPPLTVGQTKSFAHLKVTVTRVDRTSDSYFFGAKVKVCVTSLPAGRSSIRLSWDAWSINGGIRPGGLEEGTDPWAGANAPLAGSYRVGGCLKGWLPFGIAGTTRVTRVNYANSLGNRVSWKVTTGTSPQRALGSTATFRNFSVQVTRVTQDRRAFRAYAKVCVVKLPPGSTGGKTRISWDPWVANAGQHFGFTPQVSASSHWTNQFPKSGRYKKGQCARGWLTFEGVDSSLPIDRVSYRNALGNRAFWTAR